MDLVILIGMLRILHIRMPANTGCYRCETLVMRNLVFGSNIISNLVNVIFIITYHAAELSGYTLCYILIR